MGLVSQLTFISSDVTFRKNGFLLEEDVHAPPGQRFRLKAVPFSKNITFGLTGTVFHLRYLFSGKLNLKLCL